MENEIKIKEIKKLIERWKEAVAHFTNEQSIIIWDDTDTLIYTSSMMEEIEIVVNKNG